MPITICVDVYLHIQRHMRPGRVYTVLPLITSQAVSAGSWYRYRTWPRQASLSNVPLIQHRGPMSITRSDRT
jgi:hypothetical protein